MSGAQIERAELEQEFWSLVREAKEVANSIPGGGRIEVELEDRFAALLGIVSFEVSSD